MYQMVERIVREEEGQDLVEYALLLGLIALVCVAAVTVVGTEVDRLFDAIGTKLKAIVVP